MSTRQRLVIDGLLFGGFLAAENPVSTGLSLHEWLSLALVGPALFHLVLNWDWVVRTAKSALRKLRAASRVNLAVDGLLFVSAVTVMLSGLMVSRVIATAAGFASRPQPVWRLAHSLSADAVYGLIVLHAALHWKWIAQVARRIVLQATGRALQAERGD